MQFLFIIYDICKNIIVWRQCIQKVDEFIIPARLLPTEVSKYGKGKMRKNRMTQLVKTKIRDFNKV